MCQWPANRSPPHLARLHHAQVRIKMATADDEMTSDIVIEGDPEEIDRFRKVRPGCVSNQRGGEGG